MNALRGLCVGAGYFANFHLDAWKRIPGAEIVALCDKDQARLREASGEFQIDQTFSSLEEALDNTTVDFVDIITPPASHLELVQIAAQRGLPVICQKPLAPDLATAQEIVRTAEEAGIRFMVHENFRFQPWHREVKQLIESGAIGSKQHSIHCRTRMGDGWGDDAYLGRQPYFREMPRFLVQETGVHFIDTFRYLVGEIVEVYCLSHQYNEVIQGEDSVQLSVRFSGGATGFWDANRYNESLSENPRYTFGAFQIEGNEGTIWVAEDGSITLKRLGELPAPHDYEHQQIGFAGDCVKATQQHFIDCLRDGSSFETNGLDYLINLNVVEATYLSAAQNRPVRIHEVLSANSKRVLDLSLPVSNSIPGVQIEPCKHLAQDGWNATTLALYSHSGTHMDAPRHFIESGQTLDSISLDRFLGTAKVVDLTPVVPCELISVEKFRERIDILEPGDRLLLRTDWHHRFGTSDYRNELPRISVDLAKWLVSNQVAMIGVEPPSVADVNNLDELTEVHRILFEGDILIVEGLANLDQLKSSVIEFMAFPLRIENGDGCPVRAVAVEARWQENSRS